MSLLDGMFDTGGEITVSPMPPLEADATLQPGYVYLVRGGTSAPLRFTIGASSLETVAGQRIALKVIVHGESEPGTLTMAAPSGQQIDDGFGGLATEVDVPGGLTPGTYAEWTCDALGQWWAVGGGGGGGGGGLVIQDEGIEVAAERGTINFVGGTVTAVDNPTDDRVDITITAPTAGVAVQDEGAAVATRGAINFIGAGVTAVDNGAAGRVDITITAPTAGVAVQDEGAAVATRGALNFIGSGVTAVDNGAAGRVDVTIASSAQEQDWADSGHADNLNFNGPANVLPAGLALFNGSGTSFTVGTTPTVNPPTLGTVNPRVSVPVSGNDGSKVRCDVNALRPKWMFFQAPTEASGGSPPQRFFMGKKWSVAAATNMMLMIRYQIMQMAIVSTGVLQSFHGRSIFYICKDLAGVPDFSTYVSVNWAPRTAVDGSGDLYSYTVSAVGNGAIIAGAQAGISLIAPSVVYTAPTFEWFWVNKIGLDWFIYGANSRSGNIALIGQITFTSIWTPAWWGWVQNMGNGAPVWPALGIKHMWRYDNPQPIY